VRRQPVQRGQQHDLHVRQEQPPLQEIQAAAATVNGEAR
jgi:hypothetical protein